MMYKINNKDIKILDAKELGLSARTIIGKSTDRRVVLIKDRNSRIIMKDGEKIFEQINKIKKSTGTDRVILATQAPICSKTTKFFADNHIEVVLLDKQNA